MGNGLEPLSRWILPLLLYRYHYFNSAEISILALKKEFLPMSFIIGN
jgi:hypothetical protein